tara:strand:+ start:5658 stop:6050 length:393 start_codon:yes stop_codon:yes gene_type:complete
MKRSELKKIIKPMVAECIKESLLEEGILSTVISEVVKGMNAQLMVEDTPVATVPAPQPKNNISTKKLQETKKKMLNAIGKGAYNGVDIFEGTTPAPAQQTSTHGPLKDLDPSDSGVDISGLMNTNWGKLV